MATWTVQELGVVRWVGGTASSARACAGLETQLKAHAGELRSPGERSLFFCKLTLNTLSKDLQDAVT